MESKVQALGALLIVSLLPIPSPPPPQLGETSIFVNSGITSLCFPRMFPEARGTEEPAPGHGSALRKWVQEPSPAMWPGQRLTTRPTARAAEWGVCAWHLAAASRAHWAALPSHAAPARPLPLAASLGTWPRQVSVAARAVIAPSGQMGEGTPLGLAQGQGEGRSEPAVPSPMGRCVALQPRVSHLPSPPRPRARRD